MTHPPRSRRHLRAAFFLLGANLVSLAGSSFLLRAADMLQSGGEDPNSVSEKSKAALVQVHSGDGSVTLAGSGFFVDGKGTVLTSSSVIGDNTTVRVEVNGQDLPARIIGNDPRSGVALLKVTDDGSPSLPMGQSTDLKSGYAVMTLGYPLNLPVAASQGLVSGFDVRYLNQFFATTHIHASVPITPGQVGGPLLNMKGEVIGLVGPSPDDGRSVYALPVEAVEKIMDDFAQYGRARHGWVGVNVIEVPDTQHDGRTVRVVQTVPGTPASRSGILPGDTVLRIDSREVYRPADVLDASFFSHVGGNMNVVVRRNEALFNFSFAVIERPSAPPNMQPAHVAPATTMQAAPSSDRVAATK